MKFRGLLRVAAVVLTVATVRPVSGQTLYSQDFDVDDTANLWQRAYDRSGSGAYAWKVVLSAMLSDVRIAFY